MPNTEQNPTCKADITSLLAGPEHSIHRSGLVSGGLEWQPNSVGNDNLGSDAVSSSSYQDTSMVDTDRAGGHISNIVSDNPCGTGIKIRSRQMQNRPVNPNFGDHGIAPRRIRLQKRLQVGPVCLLKQASDESEVDNGLPAKLEEVRRGAVTL